MNDRKKRKKAVFSRLVPLGIDMFAVPVVVSTLTACSGETGTNQADSKKQETLELTKENNADATWTTPKAGLFAIISKDSEQQDKQIKQSGDETLLGKMCEKIVTYDFFFNIIEP